MKDKLIKNNIQTIQMKEVDKVKIKSTLFTKFYT